MRTRLFSSLIFGLFLTSLLPLVRAIDLEADPAKGKKLLDEGDKLADKGETTEAVIRYKQAFEQLLPGMRRIPFKHEVKRDVTKREDMKALMIKEIDEEMTPDEFRGNELGMKALGLVPRSMDLKDTMVKVYSEEVAAFYDTKTKTMHLIREPEEKTKKPPTLLERLLGKTSGFDKDESKVVIAHELTHALSDQNFDLDVLHKKAKGDDDRDLALSALIEGEATLTMFAAEMSDWEGNQVTKAFSEKGETFLKLFTALAPLASGPALREAPPILKETLTFPYMNGMVFCARLTSDRGWDALNDAYRDPPLSTEQIIHPEKYRANPDPPTAIDLGKLEAGTGWKEVWRNVVGELQLSVMLASYSGKAASAGWDGDSVAVFEGSHDRLGLAWLTTWDTDKDAREFLKSYARFQSTKIGREIPEPDAFPDAIRRPNQGAYFAIERHDRDVAVVEGFDSETTERLMSKLFEAKKSEKTRETPAKQGPTYPEKASSKSQ